MIAVFTIVITMLQMSLAKQKRDQDLQIAKENREKDFEIANQTRLQQYKIEEARREKDFEIANQTRELQNYIEDRRRAAEAKAQEDQQMNTFLATYLNDMAELMLSRNFTLTDHATATVVRAKTLTTLGQLDGKRKAHLVRFLYEAQMISVGQPSIDLTDADLSSVDLTNSKLNGASFVGCNLFKAIFRETSLQDVDFENVQLIAASFDKSELTNVSFHKANLTDTSFIRAKLSESSFNIVTNADFTNVNAPEIMWAHTEGMNTIFNDAEMYSDNFTGANLVNASFVKTHLTRVDMTGARLNNANFTDADLSFTNFYHSMLPESIFDRSRALGTSFQVANLMATKWLNTVVKNVDFSLANLRSASISDDQIRRAWKTAGITLPNGSRDTDTNLLTSGDAEDQNGIGETSPWHVNSMIVKKYSEITPHIYGQYYFTRQSETMLATIWQRVQVPSKHEEWIRTGVAIIRVVGDCVSSLASYGFTAILNHLQNKKAMTEYFSF
jgi:uncharacterized protein YjbI with pentapeptide repeats